MTDLTTLTDAQLAREANRLLYEIRAIDQTYRQIKRHHSHVEVSPLIVKELSHLGDDLEAIEREQAYREWKERA